MLRCSPAPDRFSQYFVDVQLHAVFSEPALKIFHAQLRQIAAHGHQQLRALEARNGQRIVNSEEKDLIEQVRGRYRGDLTTLYM